MMVREVLRASPVSRRGSCMVMTVPPSMKAGEGAPSGASTVSLRPLAGLQEGAGWGGEGVVRRSGMGKGWMSLPAPALGRAKPSAGPNG